MIKELLIEENIENSIKAIKLDCYKKNISEKKYIEDLFHENIQKIYEQPNFLDKYSYSLIYFLYIAYFSYKYKIKDIIIYLESREYLYKKSNLNTKDILNKVRVDFINKKINAENLFKLAYKINRGKNE
jgi:hypothetical protein